MDTDAPHAARRRMGLAVVALAMLLVGCGGPAASSSGTPELTPPPSAEPSPSDPPEPSASGGPTAADDLAMLLKTLERTHPEPFHGVSREEFVAALTAYEASLPDLTPSEAVVGLMRVWAMLSREGRDGHQFAFLTQDHAGPVLPIRIYEFAEGVFITAALPPHEALAGARITAIEDTPIDEVLAAVEPLVPRDGPATVPSFRPILLLRTEVLRGLGLIGEGPVTIDLELPDGSGTAVELDPIPLDEHSEWTGPNGTHQLPQDEQVRYLADAEPFSATMLDGGTLYLRYRSIRPIGTNEVRDLLEGGDVQRVIVDILWDDVRWLELPNLPVPMRAAISVRHWVFADPDDPRLTIEPDVPVEVTAADFFAGRDPALEAALAGE